MKATFAFCLERPCLCAALRSRESFPGISVLGAQQSLRARPSLPPAAPQQLSGSDPSAQHPHARNLCLCPREERILRPPRLAQRSALSTRVPLTCVLAARAREGGVEAAQ